MNLKFFNYSGTKFNYTRIVNDYINSSKSNIYIEPFVGSGAIFFNLEKEFNHYILNDIDNNIIRIYKSFRDIDYSDYMVFINMIASDFGNIANDKDAYYGFRNWFNEKLWNSDTTDEGIGLHVLANSTINSFLRFSKNGMNNSYGNRCKILSKLEFDGINNKLQNVELCNESYQDIITDHTACYFLDPPYINEASSYTGFTLDEFKDFISKISSLNEFVYTDIINEYNKAFNGEYIRIMVSTSPSTTKYIKEHNKEYLFHKGLISNSDSYFNW